MIKTYTPPEFRASLKTLSSNIQDGVMVPWHAVQTASLKTICQPLLLRNSIAPLKTSLQTHWTAILEYLQRCHDFGVDAILFQTTLEEGPDSGAESILEDLAASSNELCSGSEDLIRQLDTSMECLAALTPQLSDLLRGSSRYVKTNEKFPKTAAFLGSPLDGFASLAATQAGLTEIRNSLCMLHQFWIVASKMCHSLMESNACIPLEHAQQLGETWKGYQQEILSAKVSITKSLDAVVIEPDIPTIFRRQQRRRGSSKSETSLPASPSMQPRRMSSLEDEEFPKGCWRFSFGERKRGSR
ncbi:hypothetical protein B0H17DRAFT_107629 [Mycena rosella]|uniref:Uncharacterized protein n=1 Tax=Mycena rosella TaxID=1033263 RepID=A0AAD7GB91_MYCRO|nr:hypothetical protein B0H17DRAFT_107629 [Mycena rosella]